MPSLDRVLKSVWLAIGVALLGALLVGAAVAGAGWLRTRGAAEAADRVADRAPGAREAGRLRPTLPEAIAGTESRILFLVPEGAPGARVPEPGRVQGAVNAAFLDPGGGVRLALERPARLIEVRYPAPGVEGPAAAPWITWEVAGDSGPTLLVSDAEGRGLREVLPAGVRPRGHRWLGDGRLLVHTAAGTPDSAVSRTFLYDPARAVLLPLAALDAAVEAASRLAARAESP
jgi:hypothetical protein